ncbi:MAG: hypothetical protein ACJ76H_06255 [Bacteriovoracaceae bacterium]
MRRPTILCFILLSFILRAYARESIKPGEESGIPERADVEKSMKQDGKKPVKSDQKETRQNQQTTDPVFYDSTTSPKEMEKKKDEDDF